MLWKNLYSDESADSYLISWFQELPFKENPKCHKTLDKIVGGSTCNWMAAPRCINILTFRLQSNLCLIWNGEPMSMPSSSREPRWLQNLLKYLPKKCSLFQKVQIILILPNFFPCTSLYEILNTRPPDFHLRLFWTIMACRAQVPQHAWTAAGSARALPLTGNGLCQKF